DDAAEYGFAVAVLDQAREGGAVTIAPLTKALEPAAPAEPGAPAAEPGAAPAGGSPEGQTGDATAYPAVAPAPPAAEPGAAVESRPSCACHARAAVARSLRLPHARHAERTSHSRSHR